MARIVGDTSSCRHGHPRTQENTYSYVTKTGSEGHACRQCRYESDKKRSKRAREQGRRRGMKYARTQRGRYSQLQKAARRRGLVCALSFEDYSLLTTGTTCAYCSGALPETGGGIDRKNSHEGYVMGNCVPCCGSCNTIRMDDLISHEEMFLVMELLKTLRKKVPIGSS